MPYRRTLRRAVGCTGIGLHSGKPVRLELKPAPAEHGIRFLRTDVGVEIPASIEYLARLDHATTLSRDGVSVDTVEHLLSALHGLGVDDALVEVDGPEVPILDGSGAPFVILIHEAGLKPLAANRRYLKILRRGEGGPGGQALPISPPGHFLVSFVIGFGPPPLPPQAAFFPASPRTFAGGLRPPPPFRVLRQGG